MSAIRIVDVFHIPEDALNDIVLQFFAIIGLKTVPVPSVSVQVKLFIVGPSGKREVLPELPKGPYQLEPFMGDPAIPTGVNLGILIKLKPLKFGTGYLEVEVDDEIAARIPFTVRPLPPAQSDVRR